MPDPRNEAARKKRVRRALVNPVYFAEMYVRPFDDNWTSPTPRFAREMLAFALTHRRSVIMLPPEFMKTTLLSQVLPLWETLSWTAMGKVLRGMLLSEEEVMAKNNLRVITWHIEENDRIAADFVLGNGVPLLRPNQREGVWRDDAIIVERTGTSKDPTIKAKGLESKGILGSRLDRVWADDVITPLNAESPAMRKKALDTMDLVVEQRIVESGRMVIAGNFNDTKDLLHTLSKREGYRMLKRPSMFVPGHPSLAPAESQLDDADLLWPENWTRERLMKVARSTPNRFRRIHLMDPRAEHGERLNVGWVQLIEPQVTPLSEATLYMGLDAAPGGDGDDLDFFNITVGAAHRFGFDIVESFNVRASAGRQATLVGVLHDRWTRFGQGVEKIGVSKVAMDRYFAGVLNVIREDLTPKIHPISTPGTKEERLEGLGAYAEGQWMRVWESAWDTRTSSPLDRNQELTLAEEWREFPFGKHDDRLDGLDVCIRVCREFQLARSIEVEIEVAGRA